MTLEMVLMEQKWPQTAQLDLVLRGAIGAQHSSNSVKIGYDDTCLLGQLQFGENVDRVVA